MKSIAQAAILSTLALAGSGMSSTQAALTPRNVAYDLFTVRVFEAYGAVAEIVMTHDDPTLLGAFNVLLNDVELALQSGQQKYPYYSDRLSDFFDGAANYDKRYKSLPEEYDAFDVSFPSFMGNAPRAYLDAVFDIVESTLPALKNQTFADWHGRARQALEKRVLGGASAALLASETREYLYKLTANAAAAERFEAASTELESRMRKEFEMDEDDE